MPTPLTFDQLIRFRENIKKSNNFVKISELYYGLSTQLVLNTPLEQLEGVNFPPTRQEELNYAMGDIDVDSVEEVGAWLTFADYATKTRSSQEEVAAQARIGLLGKVETDPTSGQSVVLWPPALRDMDPSRWPRPGLRLFSAKVSIFAERAIVLDPEDRQNFETNQKSLLKLVTVMGEPVKLCEQAETMLFTAVFINLWASFETFLKSTIFELLKKHPKKLSRTAYGRRASVTYEDIVTHTREFSSVNSLQEELIRREIERSESGDMSASGMINYIKTEFEFESSPYDAWYQLQGIRLNVQYRDIVEIKDVRNCLMHDGGKLTTELGGRYPHLPVKEGFIAVDTKYFTRTRLILSSVAFKISQSIESGKYRVRD
jgi:hypothetical protein